MIKISVIMPVYNVEKYLKECLDSIINQTLSELEIICINDGSTDSSLGILKEYEAKDNRITVINKQNEGLSETRNLGMTLAHGEYISFVDSDDFLDLNFYEKLYNAAKKYNADIACSNLYRITETKNYYLIKYLFHKCTQRPRLKYKYAKIPQHNYVMNKIYNRIKLQKSNVKFEKGIYFEDIEFSHKIVYYLRSLVTVPNTKYNYRDNPYSIVNTKSDKQQYDYKYAMRKALEFVQQNNIIVPNLNIYRYNIKREYSLFGIPVLTIREYGSTDRFYLFGKLYIFQIKNVYFLLPKQDLKSYTQTGTKIN